MVFSSEEIFNDLYEPEDYEMDAEDEDGESESLNLTEAESEWMGLMDIAPYFNEEAIKSFRKSLLKAGISKKELKNYELQFCVDIQDLTDGDGVEISFDLNVEKVDDLGDYDEIRTINPENSQIAHSLAEAFAIIDKEVAEFQAQIVSLLNIKKTENNTFKF